MIGFFNVFFFFCFMFFLMIEFMMTFMISGPLGPGSTRSSES